MVTSGTPGAPLVYGGQTYKTVVIGTQTWMAENLNYTPATTGSSSWCYVKLPANCTTYGRLYDYTTALKVCPSGWHLPDTTEWNTLEAAVGGTATAGTKLKGKSGWNYSGNGTDDYGFSCLPGGGSNIVRPFTPVGYVGNYGGWWTATPDGITNAYFQYMNNYNANVYLSSEFLGVGFSVRCLKD